MLFILVVVFAIWFCNKTTAQGLDYVECPFEVPPILANIQAGDVMQITPGDPNTLRSAPGARSNIKLAHPGEPASDEYWQGTFTIADGGIDNVPYAFCVEGNPAVWIYIEFESKFYFTAAANAESLANGEVWIEPVPQPVATPTPIFPPSDFEDLTECEPTPGFQDGEILHLIGGDGGLRNFAHSNFRPMARLVIGDQIVISPEWPAYCVEGQYWRRVHTPDGQLNGWLILVDEHGEIFAEARS